MTTALESRIAAIENRLNPTATRQKARQAEEAEANDAFSAAVVLRRRVAKEYLAAIAKLRPALVALVPLTERIAELVDEDRQAFNSQRAAVDHGAAGDVDPRLPASIEPWQTDKLIKSLDNSLEVARKFGVNER